MKPKKKNGQPDEASQDETVAEGSTTVVGSGDATDEQRLDPDDVETAEVRAIEREVDGFEFADPFFATGDCRDVMLQVIKQAVDWSKMREAAQRDVIAAVSTASVAIVQKIARAIAAEGTQFVHATLEQFVVKDGLKIVCKGPYNHDALLMLGDAQGHEVLLSLPNMKRFDNQRSAAEYTPDENELPLGPADNSDLAAAGEAVALQRDEGGNLSSVDIGAGGGDLLDQPDRVGVRTGDEITLGDNRLGTARVNLSTGLIEGIGAGSDQDDATAWEDIREATPEELAAERNRVSDFEDA
jgi:hypothetical protein